MSTRLQNWPVLLPAYIEERRCMPFAWGTHDCCQFARRAIETITGVDPALEWDLRPYKTARGALYQLKRLGGLAALPSLAGLSEVPLNLAGRGDVVLIPNNGHPALGIILGAQAVYPGKDALAFLPCAVCAQAWRVG